MENKNLNGMRYPSIDALVGKDDEFVLESGENYSKKHTKYQVAYLAAKRAHEIENDEKAREVLNKKAEDDETIDIEMKEIDENNQHLCVKPVGMALEEYLRGEVHCSFKSNDLGDTRKK